MTTNILIADDEKAARQKIKSLLKDYVLIGKVQEASDGKIALEMLREFRPDIVFMDIQMPEMTGIEVASQCLDLNYHLVFVTAYDEYALNAFENHAVDYLLKPVSKARFQRTMDRLLVRSEPNSTEVGNLAKLLQTLAPSQERLVIKSGGSLLLIDAKDIGFCSAEEGISKINLLASGQSKHNIDSLFCDLSLNELLRRLPPHLFFQVHRSYLVNLNQILAIHPDGRSHYLQLKAFPDRKIPVSRTQFAELQLKLQRL